MGGSHFPLVSFPLPTAKELTQKRRCNGITWPQPEGAGVPGGVWEGLKWLSRVCQPHYSLFSWICRLQEAIGGGFVRTFDLSMVDSISQTSANQGNRFPVFSQLPKLGMFPAEKTQNELPIPLFSLPIPAAGWIGGFRRLNFRKGWGGWRPAKFRRRAPGGAAAG